MRIQHNISALNSHRNLMVNNSGAGKNLEKLSSGYRINRAGDDAAGLAISEKMRGQIRGLAMAEKNTAMGINLIQTAEGGLNETHAILQRMRELAVQSSNGTYDNAVDRANLEQEFQDIKAEIDRISQSTHYNGINLLDGSLGGTKVDATTTGNTSLVISSLTAPPAGSVGAGVAWSGSFSVKMSTGAMIGNTVAVTYEISMIDSEGKANNFTYETSLDSTGGLEKLTLNGNPGLDWLTVAAAGNNLQATLTDSNGATIVLDLNAAATAGVGANNGAAIMNYSYNGTAAAAPTIGIENAYNLEGKGRLTFQIGANGGADQRVDLSVFDMSSNSLGLGGADRLSDASIATVELANRAIDIITAATNQVSAQRANLGALQNRLEHTMNNLGVTKENLTASESTIRDVDMAEEMMQFTKNNILVQASQAMLAQANQLPQGVLQLLR